ncbi:aminotransferase class V-fold PLP-dependent enzyme [Roseateles koreensis]|uniref:cysteine desulfurase n=1 Tax=Roseateles koreensis TaxID=2987526 RepID=A0ABT5KR43_9BURK|nr:aminotransferase class V-fold PLP-dependent enzyme [Roseateles koreensis]MDC8785383.1 aminotransferase class V-fold PLP-dependent enzyme [Roseateles koreensis]
MEIYLDANATTPVLAQARDAAMSALTDTFGNPSSIHSTGLKARTLLDAARLSARRVLGAPSGRLVFVSGATEGIQTAVLSALKDLQDRQSAPGTQGDALAWLLYGATEHKAVPEALKHWNELLGLGLQVLAIPVGPDGRHDLAWLRAHASRAGLVCTMAANNETGVVSDLEGIGAVLADSPALWLVDSVQALGKLPLRLNGHFAGKTIDYAPFSGHKLYAPKGIGMLYVREGAPFTPLMAGGGQEDASRSGTENMAGIAALGAVFDAIEAGQVLKSPATLAHYREQLAATLTQTFNGLIFNADFDLSLPTTLNFSVPGLSAKLLLDLFDAANVRVSGGSACSAAKAQPSHVLQAMGLPAWQAASAVRLSFGPAAEQAFIDEACARIKACGAALRASCLNPPMPALATRERPEAPVGLTRYAVNGACCYVLADASSRRCVVIDPLPELTEPLSQWLRCQGYTLAAALDTHSHGDHTSAAADLRAAVPAAQQDNTPFGALGWPENTERIVLGEQGLTRLALPGHTQDSTAYLLHEGASLRLAFVGDMVMPGALGRSDFMQSAPFEFGPSLLKLLHTVGPDTLLLPGHDYDDRHATCLRTEIGAQPLLAAVLQDGMDPAVFAASKAKLEQGLGLTVHQTLACGARVDRACANEATDTVELCGEAVAALLHTHPGLHLVDVREAYEHRVGTRPAFGRAAHHRAVPLSGLINVLPEWLALPADTPVLFYCRSGNRSAAAAQALRRLGHRQAWSLNGGLALWADTSRVTQAH